MTKQEQFAQALKGWLATDSWYTGHSLDEDRFRRAIRYAISSIGTDWSEQEFEDAVYANIGEQKRAAFEEYVHDFASIADHLREYAKLA